jgi:2-polyprenyl-3-methyl-5-hydroxy-6-metoxy-1,4-benzoquinol methylase
MSASQGSDPDAALRARRAHAYETARPDIQAHVPAGARRILELGCSVGALGAALKQRNAASVLGVEIDADYGRLAAAVLDRVVVGDVEQFLAGPVPPEAPFDTLIAADVLEHLVDPWRALERASAWLTPGATVVVSLPNVMHWVGLLRVIGGGRWPRDDAGVFDRTHLRWFTMRDAVELLEGAGLAVETLEPRYPGTGVRLALSKALGATPLRRLLAVQWIVVAVKPSA